MADTTPPIVKSESATQLYLVCANSDDGENLDLIVEAADETEAEVFWINYAIITWPEMSHGVEPENIWLIPDKTGEAHAFDW